MFDTPVEDPWGDLGIFDLPGLASLVEANEAELIVRENRVLQLTAAWADVHAVDPDATTTSVGIRSVRAGGDGTPWVSEFAGSELGVLLGRSPGAGKALLGDVLDMRHRLPGLWRLVLAGRVRGWQARKVAQATRPLPVEAAFQVDQALSGYANQLGWARFTRLLDAAVQDADPQLAADRAAAARRGRGVWTTQARDGDKTIVARTNAGTVTWFLATVNRVADLLAAEGDTDTADERRAKSLQWLAHPDRLLELFRQHQHDPDRHDLDLDDGQSGIEGEGEGDSDDHEAGGEVVVDEHDQPVGRPDPELVVEDTHQSVDLTRPAGDGRPAARPRVVLHFHLSDAVISRGCGVVRPEHDPSPISLDELRRFLADTGCTVTVRPVIDPADSAPVDSYEIPHRLRQAVRHRHPAEVFPYGSSVNPGLDLDHTRPFQRGGPPGQTSLTNLGPLSRAAHRAKTFGRWHCRQPDPGTYVWRTPTGRIFLVTNQGTLPLGCTAFSHALWDLATMYANQEPPVN